MVLIYAVFEEPDGSARLYRLKKDGKDLAWTQQRTGEPARILKDFPYGTTANDALRFLADNLGLELSDPGWSVWLNDPIQLVTTKVTKFDVP